MFAFHAFENSFKIVKAFSKSLSTPITNVTVRTYLQFYFSCATPESYKYSLTEIVSKETEVSNNSF